MANQDRQAPPQPAEDMFGRPTDVRHDEPEREPARKQQGAHQMPEREHQEAGARSPKKSDE
ncbi:MAG TPA: hypothetical protein VEY88_00535 [Archangium sp.]|jgi:hypothetical protein|nr:hypothetical protein [Archangium sp.]